MSNNIRLHLNQVIEDALLPLVSKASEHICIIDPPGHPNVGDSTILLGELDFMARYFPAARLSYYDVDSYSPGADRFVEEATILLIHGGGNFGDIWPYFHRLRMRILDRFPHKPIVQLPQSIHFDHDRELRSTANAIRRQSNFTLMVRDQNSLDYVRRHFDCKVVLSPDMAFAMQPITRKRPSVDHFCLLRTDKEAVVNRSSIYGALAATGRSVELRDWLDERRNLVAFMDRRLKRLTGRLPAITAPFRSAAMQLRQRYAMQRLSYGVNLLSQGTTVVTDRLHAHILCCLLGIPHYTFDSYDGKISAFHATWTKEYTEGQLISSPAELVSKIGQSSHRDV